MCILVVMPSGHQVLYQTIYDMILCKRIFLCHYDITIIKVTHLGCIYVTVSVGINCEPLLGVIPEQGACPLRPKGARSKAKNKKGARSRKRVILEQGAETFQTKKEHGAEKSNPEARNNPGAWGKWKKEQGAKKNEKVAKK